MDYHAKEYINKAIKMNENNIEFKDLAGRILYKTGEYDKAEKFLKASILINEKNSEIFSLLGQSCLKQQKMDEALDFFNKSLKINPENAVAKNGITECATRKISI
jgi:tetratricopeptide (TPR) repeat protein